MNYNRRPTVAVRVGGVQIGGGAPVVLQSMTSTSTNDTDASVAQITRIARAGGQIVRLTAQGVREAENLAEIRDELRRRGVDVPLVADIHFNPRAAFAAAERVEKVRINPGNFVDPGRVFKNIDYTDEQYARELEKIDQAFTPLIGLCRSRGAALRIGVNHGSLSDRIMSRYGNTPAGMVESALEFLRVCRRRDFDQVVISIKASNVGVMVETVRLLARKLDKEGMRFPLHLGVTEAGDGEDGRVKSAVGIGTLLAEGLGDTIRVSLTEEPEREIPVARALRDYVETFARPLDPGEDFDGPLPQRSATVPVVVGHDLPEMPQGVVVDGMAALAEAETLLRDDPGLWIILDSRQANRPAHLRALAAKIHALGLKNRIMLTYKPTGDVDADALKASVDLGGLLLDGVGDGLAIDGAAALALNILQATRVRMTKTEFIACPSCGRTMYDLQDTLARIKAATSHLKGLKIGVMGCIVNGPGEMADADYGYVGSGVGKVNLYKGKTCLEKNIPTAEAIPRLIQLIKDGGDWVEPGSEE